jgi:hypothetical protein
MADVGITKGVRVQALFRCPWHDDRSPSLSVNWESALFHCFGETCGVHGSLGALRRPLGKHTPTYRQGCGASPVGKLGCVDEAVERLANGLESLSQPDKARRLRECKSVYAVGECSACGIAPEVVLAMPPALAEVYLAEDVLPLHDCEDCGFRLPHGRFDACLLCGGRIGWDAYWQKHKDGTSS